MPTTTETTGRRSYVLLDLDVQGRVYRFTDAPETQSITDAAGRAYAYAPGLLPLSLAKDANGAASSLAIAIQAPQEVSWARMVARGHVLERATCIVRQWYVGQVMESARVWIRGKVTGPSWGNDDEPLAFTVERLRRESGVIPSGDMIVDATTWPVTSTFSLDEAAKGAWYPMVYGEPAGGTTPAYLVEYKATDLDNCKLLIAGHKVEASSVTVHDTKGDASWTETVYEMSDLLGRTVSYVTFANSTVAPEEDREYRIAWDQGGGGYVDGQQTTALDGAGDLMTHFLRRWTDMDVDWGRFNDVLTILNSYKLGFAIVAQVRAWDFIEGEILRLLPVDWVQSEVGEHPRPWALEGSAAQARGHIDCTCVTGRYTRVGPVSSSGGTIYNSFTLRYYVAGAQQRPSRSVTLGPGVDASGKAVVTDSRGRPNLWCRLSESVFGNRPAPALSTEIVYDDATASRIVRDQARLYALPRRALQVEGDLTLDAYDLGDVVTITATDVEITDEPATVRAKEVRGDVVTLTLLLLDPPAARTRPTT